MLWLFHNRVANWHFHELPNGIIVDHAHPYAKIPFSTNNFAEDHQHNDIEFLILDLIFKAVLFVLTGLVLLRIFKIFLQIFPILNYFSYPISAFAGLPCLRAPPRS